MSHLYRATGVVLGKKPWREADVLYTFFTKEYGKLEVWGRGAQKPRAKLTSHLAHIAECEFLIVQGRQKDILAGVERVHAFPGMFDDFKKLLLAQNGFALLDFVTRSRQIDRSLYAFLFSWLTFLESSVSFSAERAAYLFAGYALKLLAACGYEPELKQCLSCKTRVRNKEEFFWHVLHGGLVCQSCVRKDAQHWFSARAIATDTVKMLRFSLERPFFDLLRLSLPRPLLTDFHEKVEVFFVTHFPVIPPTTLRGACMIE